MTILATRADTVLYFPHFKNTRKQLLLLCKLKRMPEVYSDILCSLFISNLCNNLHNYFGYI